MLEQEHSTETEYAVHVRSLERLLSRAAEGMDSKEFQEECQKAITGVAVELDRILSVHSESSVVFVTGGKSRRLSEILLRSSIYQMRDKQATAWKLFSERVRLDDEMNKGLYEEYTSDGRMQDFLLPPQSERGKKIHYIFFDDHTRTGDKARRILEKQGKHGVWMHFISWTGQRPLPSDHLREHIFLPPTEDGLSLFTVVIALSKALSSVTDFRDNGRTGLFGLPRERKTVQAYEAKRRGAGQTSYVSVLLKLRELLQRLETLATIAD